MSDHDTASAATDERRARLRSAERRFTLVRLATVVSCATCLVVPSFFMVRFTHSPFSVHALSPGNYACAAGVLLGACLAGVALRYETAAAKAVAGIALLGNLYWLIDFLRVFLRSE